MPGRRPGAARRRAWGGKYKSWGGWGGNGANVRVASAFSDVRFVRRKAGALSVWLARCLREASVEPLLSRIQLRGGLNLVLCGALLNGVEAQLEGLEDRGSGGSVGVQRLDLEGALLDRGGQAVDRDEYLRPGVLNTKHGAEEEGPASTEPSNIWARRVGPCVLLHLGPSGANGFGHLLSHAVLVVAQRRSLCVHQACHAVPTEDIAGG